MCDVSEKQENLKRSLHLVPALVVGSLGQGYMAPPRLIRLEGTIWYGGNKPRSATSERIVVRSHERAPFVLVGGTQAIVEGWVVQVPEDVEHVLVEFDWLIPMKFGRHARRVIHCLQIDLEESSSNFYSMDRRLWPKDLQVELAGRGAILPVSVRDEVGERERIVVCDSVDLIHVTERISLRGIEEPLSWAALDLLAA